MFGKERQIFRWRNCGIERREMRGEQRATNCSFQKRYRQFVRSGLATLREDYHPLLSIYALSTLELVCQGNDRLFYFRKRFSNAWRASSGFDEEVSRSMVVRGE